jgi:hypothetical protein
VAVFLPQPQLLLGRELLPGSETGVRAQVGTLVAGSETELAKGRSA